MKLIQLNLDALPSLSNGRSDQYAHRLNDPEFKYPLPEGRSELLALERKKSKHNLQKLNLDLELELITDQKATRKAAQKLSKEKATIAEWAFEDAEKSAPLKKKDTKEVDDAIADELLSADDSKDSDDESNEDTDSDSEGSSNENSSDIDSEFTEV